MARSSGNMKSYWSLNVVITLLSLVLVVKGVNVGLNFYEDTTISSGSTGTVGRLVKKDERVPVVATEFGEVSSIDIDDGLGKGGHKYDIQFITLEPNSVFLPVLLHADMVFYVQTGSGKISWTDGDELNDVYLQRGDVYKLKSGTLFYLHSGLEAERPRLRIIAIFTNPEEQELQGRLIGPYSSINDLVRGFDKRILQAAFQVSEEVIEELTSATDTPAIVHAEPKKKNFWQQELLLIKAFLGIQRFGEKIAENKKKHTKTFNFFKEDPDFKNCNGWSTLVTKKNLHALKGSNIGVFMVNLTKGSMMGPHWNPMAAEVSIVLEGEGMVRVVCPSALTNKECKNSRFKIEEGDAFTVPRFHPMAQTSFNNGSLVFMGFSTTTKKNHPQFLAGKASVLQTLRRPILGASFNVSNTTIDQLLAAQKEAIILDCISCAEEQEMLLEDQIEKERQEEEDKRREEEEARRKKEEEEQRKREEEEKEQRRKEEEERKREEEEARRKKEEEEQRKREEEQRRKEEEERERKEQEKREEEEEQRRREEEERKREEEARKREEEEEQRRKEEERKREEQKELEEEEEQRRREEEEEVRRKEEEKEQKRREEEEREREKKEQKRRKEEEEARRKEEEEQQRRQEEEELEREKEQTKRKKEEEEQRRQEEEKERQREEKEEKQRAEEEQQRKREEERQQEKEKRRQEERGRGEEEEETEQEIAKREEEERREWEKQAEEAARRRQEKEKRRREERGRGEEEETEQEIAKREEEERREWEKQEEEAARKRQEREEGKKRRKEIPHT